MPPYGLLPAARPDPFAGQNAAAFVKIFQTLGQFETLRRQKMLNTDILGILQGGGDPQTIMQGIAGAVQQHQQPTYSPEFLPGLFQRIAAPFAQAPGAGITEALTAQAFKPQPRTEIQKLTAEGYTPQEAKMIRDISHGLEPRASTRQTYENMTEIEKLDFLSKVKQRAEGQYYGVLRGEAEMIAETEGKEPRKVQPRDPKLLDWTLRELNKLPQYRQQGTELPPTETQPSGLKAEEGVSVKAKPKLTPEKPTEKAAQSLMWRRWKLPTEIGARIDQYLEAGWTHEQIWDVVKGIPVPNFDLTVEEFDELMQGETAIEKPDPLGIR